MKWKTMCKRIWRGLRGNLFSVLLFVAIFAIFIGGINQAATSQTEEALRIARDSIVRAAISCYAIEGSYPESYAYLKEHYQVQVDESKFAVHYEIFASNIMPDISVVLAG